jgi:hypothetical protein
MQGYRRQAQQRQNREAQPAKENAASAFGTKIIAKEAGSQYREAAE